MISDDRTLHDRFIDELGQPGPWPKGRIADLAESIYGIEISFLRAALEQIAKKEVAVDKFHGEIEYGRIEGYTRIAEKALERGKI